MLLFCLARLAYSEHGILDYFIKNIKEKNLLISKKYLYLNLVIKQKLNKINDIPEIKGSTSFKSQTNTPIQTNDVYGIRINKIKDWNLFKIK